MKVLSTTLSSVLALAAAACCHSGSGQSEAGSSPAPVATAPTARKKQTPTLPAQMERHSKTTRRAFAAAVSGDLDRMKDAMRALAEDEWTPALKAEWKEHQDSLRAASRQVVAAKGRADALESFVLVGQSCADCHRGAGGLQVPAGEAPPVGSDEMLHHQWAAEQMWLGLVAPSDEAWERGAKAMTKARLLRSDSREIDRIARRVVEMSKKAREVPSHERPAVMSRFLSTCGQCHDLLQIEIGAD